MSSPKETGQTFPCPICGKPAVVGSKEFPFCRERCRLVDLGNWLKEEYHVSRPLALSKGQDVAPEDEDEAKPPVGDSDEE